MDTGIPHCAGNLISMEKLPFIYPPLQAGDSVTEKLEGMAAFPAYGPVSHSILIIHWNKCPFLGRHGTRPGYGGRVVLRVPPSLLTGEDNTS
jgi:hypothetical protein